MKGSATRRATVRTLGTWRMRRCMPGSLADEAGRLRSRPSPAAAPPAREGCARIPACTAGVWRSLVSALVWGTRGRQFKSGHADQLFFPPCLCSVRRDVLREPVQIALEGIHDDAGLPDDVLGACLLYTSPSPRD